MKNTDYAVISIYNNGNADVVTENGVIYTDKEGAYSFILSARRSLKEVAWKRYENGDQTWWFN